MVREYIDVRNRSFPGNPDISTTAVWDSADVPSSDRHSVRFVAESWRRPVTDDGCVHEPIPNTQGRSCARTALALLEEPTHANLRRDIVILLNEVNRPTNVQLDASTLRSEAFDFAVQQKLVDIVDCASGLVGITFAGEVVSNNLPH